MSYDRQRLRGYHPATCTCTACQEKRRRGPRKRTPIWASDPAPEIQAPSGIDLDNLRDVGPSEERSPGWVPPDAEPETRPASESRPTESQPPKTRDDRPSTRQNPPTSTPVRPRKRTPIWASDPAPEIQAPSGIDLDNLRDVGPSEERSPGWVPPDAEPETRPASESRPTESQPPKTRDDRPSTRQNPPTSTPVRPRKRTPIWASDPAPEIQAPSGIDLDNLRDVGPSEERSPGWVPPDAEPETRPASESRPTESQPPKTRDDRPSTRQNPPTSTPVRPTPPQPRSSPSQPAGQGSAAGSGTGRPTNVSKRQPSKPSGQSRENRYVAERLRTTPTYSPPRPRPAVPSRAASRRDRKHSGEGRSPWGIITTLLAIGILIFFIGSALWDLAPSGSDESGTARVEEGGGWFDLDCDSERRRRRGGWLRGLIC